MRLSQMPSWTSASSGPSPATSAYSPTRRASGGDELAALGFDAVDQLAERVGELLDALALEDGDHVVVVDAGLGESLEDTARLVDVLLERERDVAVILEGVDRLLRHRVHGLRADQLLDVDHVAIGRVLGRGRCPEAALRPRPLRPDPLPALARVELLVPLVGELRVRDGELALQFLRRAGLLKPLVGL